MALPKNRPSILVIDDDSLVAASLALILVRMGFDARAVHSGEEAVQLAATLKPDVLIADVMMNGIDGVAAAQQITKIVPSCRVALISGEHKIGAWPKLPADSKDDFEVFFKPVDPQLIMEYIERRN